MSLTNADRAALFGSGGQNPTQLIQNVWIGGNANNPKEPKQNPYTVINDVLGKLGFSANGLHHDTQVDHYNHYHVDLRATTRVPLQQNLLADNAASNQSALVANDALIANAQSLLEQVKADLNLTQGEVTMFIPDMPDVPPQNVPVMIALANQVQVGDVKTTRTLGVCFPAPNKNYSLENVIEPIGDARVYLREYEPQTVNGPATITVLQQPTHGILRLVTEADGNTFGEGRFVAANQLYAYLPENGYLGKDQAVALVEIGGVKVKVIYFFQAVGGGLGNTGVENYCGEKGPYWKISSTLDADGNATLTAIDYQGPVSDNGSTDFSSWLAAAQLDAFVADASKISVTFADLAGAALGSTSGATITLDDDAAGHHWYLDPTPSDNSEFLPTANPNEWVAKEGSEAAGKMDMLSVLLHEYGHALGIEHSSSAHDYMSTTLQPGVRRLPSADELALMAQLAGEIKGDVLADSNTPDSPQSPLPLGSLFGVALLGRLRRTDYDSWTNTIDSVGAIPQFDIAANPKLDNTTFTGSSPNQADGWSTTGTVHFANGAATLNETAATQTRLNQVFIVGDTDRFLSFTVANLALDDAPNAPDDAFEVALLDANTGLSLLGGTGLSHNDAFLNLQADGSEHKAQAVTPIRNADGSRTYLIDLAGIPAGTAVNLGFDLIGFGKGAAAISSHLTIRDLRIGVPQTMDDSVTLAEDTPVTINALANDLNRQPGFVPVIVDALAHGQIAFNVDASGQVSFTYTPTRITTASTALPTSSVMVRLIPTSPR